MIRIYPNKHQNVFDYILRNTEMYLKGYLSVMRVLLTYFEKHQTSQVLCMSGCSDMSIYALFF